MKWAILILMMMSVLMMGSDCERERLDSLDNGFMETSDGLVLTPMVLPWEVVAEDMEHPEALSDAMEMMNEWFFPTEVFFGGIDSERFTSLDLGPESDRYGIILVSVGSMATSGWEDGLDFEDSGGIADLAWNEAGEILFVDIIVNIDYAYNVESTCNTLLHEFGHSLGFGHDGDSIDLGSCMSSPAPYDCLFTEADRNRF